MKKFKLLKKRSFTKAGIFSKLFLLLFFVSANFVLSAQTTTLNYLFSVLGTTTINSPSGDMDENISFSTIKNSPTSYPSYNGGTNEIRLYYFNTGNGNSMILTPSNGVIITDVVIHAVSSYCPIVTYNVDAGDPVSAILSGTNYTISGIYATSSLEFRNANISANIQLRFTSITVTYISTDPSITVTYPTTNPVIVNSPNFQLEFDVNNFDITETTGDGKVKYTFNEAVDYTHADSIYFELELGLNTIVLELVDNSNDALDPPVITDTIYVTYEIPVTTITITSPADEAEFTTEDTISITYSIENCNDPIVQCIIYGANDYTDTISDITNNSFTLPDLMADEYFLVLELYCGGNENRDTVAVVSFTVVEPPAPPQPKTYQLVTSDADLVDGGQYLIVGKHDADYYALGYQKSGSNPNRHAVLVNQENNLINILPAQLTTDQTSPFEITFEVSNEYFGLYDTLNSQYLRPSTTGTNQLTLNSTLVEFSVNIDSITHIAAVSAIDATTYIRPYMQYNYNNGTPLFNCYAATSQSPVYLYKAITEPTISISSPANNEIIPLGDDVNVVYTVVCAPENSTVKYSLDGATSWTTTTASPIELGTLTEGPHTITIALLSDFEVFLSVATVNFNCVAPYIPQPKLYQLVTSNDDIVDGGKYLFVGKHDSDYFAMGLFKSSNSNRKAVTINQGNNVIYEIPAEIPSDTVHPFEFTLSQSETGFSIFDNVNHKYLVSATTGTSNQLKLADTVISWSFNVEATGISTVVCIDGATDHNEMRFNINIQNQISNPLFACYTTASGQSKVYLYRLIESSEPMLSILSPENNSTIETNEATVNYVASNFALGTQGKIKYSLDEAKTIVYTTDNPIIISDLGNGQHTVNFELVNMDNTSLTPAVTKSITFNVLLTGIETVIEQDMFVYPNPASDYFYVNSTETIDNISIVNINGQTLLEMKSVNDKQKINISNFNAGTYFIIVTNNNGTKISKLLVK
ncbi:MAG: T9SS type A sorting domain-containing protein [Bacteroidales bacterium]|jgi:hypothetical protein|nr:T9SS type A sorting domain-containing protein [Bacteroidales bacterium]